MKSLLFTILGIAAATFLAAFAFAAAGCIDPNVVRREGAVALRSFATDFDTYDKDRQEAILAVHDGTETVRLTDYIEKTKKPIKAAINVVNAVLQSKDIATLVMRLLGAWSDLAVLVARVGIPIKLPALSFSFSPPCLQQSWAFAEVL